MADCGGQGEAGLKEKAPTWECFWCGFVFETYDQWHHVLLLHDRPSRPCCNWCYQDPRSNYHRVYGSGAVAKTEEREAGGLTC